MKEITNFEREIENVEGEEIELKENENNISKQSNESNEEEKREVADLKFQLEHMKKKLEANENNIKNYLSLQREYEIKYSTLLKEQKEKGDEIKLNFKKKEESFNIESVKKEKEQQKMITKLKEEIENLKQEKERSKRENDYYLSKNLMGNATIQKDEMKNQMDEKETIISELKSEINEQNEKIRKLSMQNDNLLRESNDKNIQNLTMSVQNAFNPTLNTQFDNKREILTKRKKNPLYDINHIQQLREKAEKIEEETVLLTRELSLKYDEVESLYNEIYKLRNIIKKQEVKKMKKDSELHLYMNNEHVSQSKIDDDIRFANLEALVDNYGNTIAMLKDSYQEALIKHQQELDILSQEYEAKVQMVMEENLELKRALNISRNYDSKGQGMINKEYEESNNQMLIDLNQRISNIENKLKN